jgi:squalene-hopene/tetraprenyl-beta-curcumene cyclase
MLKTSLSYGVLMFTLATAFVGTSSAEEAVLDAEMITKAKKAVDRGLHFLRGKQSKDGSYGHHVGITSMTMLAFGESHRQYRYDDGPFMRLAVDWLAKKARADGAITGEATPTYNTALAITGLKVVGQNKFDGLIKAGQDFLVRFQSDEERQYRETDKFYGGIGYGGDERPDLSNLQYALEALKKTDYDPKSDVWQKAQKFISRCQNRSESNDQPWAGDDGGFVYAPGQSPAGETRSYGALSFAGLKSLILTRAGKDDPRVKAVWNWIRKNYDFTIHPGMETTSYFYYLQTAAEALHTYGEAYVPDDRGRKRVWAKDLVSRMLTLQEKDGSWVNSNKKYWEGNPVLVTARAVITLNRALRSAGVTK